MDKDTLTYNIQGSVKSGYESIKQMFESFYKDELDLNSQLCIYVDNEVVVDLCGHTPEDERNKDHTFGPDTTTTIWSSGKAVADIMMAILFDQGCFRYEDKVCTHWPEFAQNGKDQISIQDILRHESHLQKLPVQIDLDWT